MNIMKILSTLFLLLITITVCAQKGEAPTDNFIVTGLVQNEMKFNLADIEKYQPKKINDVIVEKYREESGSTAAQMMGVLLKNIFTAVELNTANPKEDNKFNITLKNAHGQTLVYSWKQIFNSAVGNNVYIITSQDGKMFSDMDDRILVISSSESNTGRGYIKNLSEIHIQKAK